MTNSNRKQTSKYQILLDCLEPDQVYTAAKIARIGDTAKLYSLIHKNIRDEHAFVRTRIALGAMTRNHQFPDEGDGYHYLHGHFLRGWLGWRWQGFVSESDARQWRISECAPLYERLEDDALYTLDQVVALALASKEPEPTLIFRKHHRYWRRAWRDYLGKRYWLWMSAKLERQGLVSQQQAYPASVWRRET